MRISRLKWIAAPLILGVGTAGAVALSGGPSDRPPEASAPQGRDPVPGAADSARPAVSQVDRLLRTDPVPPGYFDFPPRERKDGTASLPLIKPGQTVLVEVLEALPGRPITGERLVRADGTISLGFYGDLAVAGLNRTEAKIKVIEHLRKYLGDEVLGLASSDANGQKPAFLPPADSNRVFVADDLEYPRHYATEGAGKEGVKEGQVLSVEALQALPGRPITGERVVGPDGRINLGFYGDLHVLGLNRDQIKVKVIEHLRKFLNDEALGLIEVDKRGERHAIAPAESSRVFIDDAIPPHEPRTGEAVRQLREQVKDLNVKLDRVLKELEEIRRERRPAQGRDAGKVRAF